MKQFAFFIILLFGFTALAQQAQQFTISGKIIDSKTKEPLPSASIILLSSSQEKRTTIADADGNFTIKNTAGSYQLKVEFMSYKTLVKENFILNKNIVMNAILLEENTNQLDEVKVVSEKSSVELKLDK